MTSGMLEPWQLLNNYLRYGRSTFSILEVQQSEKALGELGPENRSSTFLRNVGSSAIIDIYNIQEGLGLHKHSTDYLKSRMLPSYAYWLSCPSSVHILCSFIPNSWLFFKYHEDGSSDVGNFCHSTRLDIPEGSELYHYGSHKFRMLVIESHILTDGYIKGHRKRWTGFETAIT